jgi:hypothetical protein
LGRVVIDDQNGLSHVTTPSMPGGSWRPPCSPQTGTKG